MNHAGRLCSVVRATIVLTAVAGGLAAAGCGEDAELARVPPAAQLFLDAQQLADEGKRLEAIAKLDAAIAAEPSVYALVARARLRVEEGQDQGALADCNAALALEPDEPTAKWLQGELAKPTAERFQGPFQKPPATER